ncbi:hypothetical protein [Aequorivita viscosa]|uniref:hypothetical protein n=1 Tax=Aequorivita viscosa TaxID=797419 RepID=UPI00115F9CB6|nr:hypothetical protein [Aequorivita viscosa]
MNFLLITSTIIPLPPLETVHLVIVTPEITNSELIEAKKWLRLALKEKRIYFHVLNYLQKYYGYKNGNPFIPAYCTAAAMVYQN